VVVKVGGVVVAAVGANQVVVQDPKVEALVAHDVPQQFRFPDLNPEGRVPLLPMAAVVDERQQSLLASYSLDAPRVAGHGITSSGPSSYSLYHLS
jgi:hypothetical protein